MRRGCNDCTVGSVFLSVITHTGSTSPTMSPATTNRWGAEAEPSVSHPGGFAVNARSVSKTSPTL
jgi:hypothetical protein